MCRLYGQGAEHADATVDLYPNYANKATAIPKSEQREAAATGEISDGKLRPGKQRLDFRIEGYGFGTHC
ncbi:MAG: hypothetical protein NDI84_06795 [Steroidobacteraceae bacterium]|nr:hypothetical protein [Steroidobacteraceae bacterium]